MLSMRERLNKAKPLSTLNTPSISFSKDWDGLESSFIVTKIKDKNKRRLKGIFVKKNNSINEDLRNLQNFNNSNSQSKSKLNVDLTSNNFDYNSENGYNHIEGDSKCSQLKIQDVNEINLGNSKFINRNNF